MTTVDHVFALALIVGLPVFAAWHASHLIQRVSDPAYSRTRDYLQTIGLQWALTLLLCGWWLMAERPLADLGLTFPGSSGRWWTIVISFAAIAFYAYQSYAVARSSEAQGKVRAQLDAQPIVRIILPTNAGEARTFGALALTAGVCEEVLYRGFLLYYLNQWLPGGAAVAAAIVIFGLAHMYQGARGIVLTGLAGGVAMALYLLTGSLIASMILHATVDLANGFIAYVALVGTRRHPSLGEGGDSGLGARGTQVESEDRA
jgi:membrane protease YdiL (CAAX protease family)